MTTGLIPAERVTSAILILRGQRVLLDADLAALYRVPTAVLNQAVGRNRERFPEDFRFQLTVVETARLRSQIVISNRRGGNRYRPYVFTEQGVAMLSSVLRSPRAIAVNIEIMRAFVRLRRVLASNASLARKIVALETKYDGQFTTVFSAIHLLMASRRNKRRIGFSDVPAGARRRKTTPAGAGTP